MLILYEFTLTIIFRQHLQIKGITICKHAPGLLQITLSISSETSGGSVKN